MPAEGFVRIDDRQTRSAPAEFASLLLRVPLGLGNQKIVVANFAVVVAGRDVEVGWSSVEVEVHAVGLASGGLPRTVVLVGVEGVESVRPSLIEPFDFGVVLLLPERQHQILVFDGPSVPEHDLVPARMDLLNSYII